MDIYDIAELFPPSGTKKAFKLGPLKILELHHF